MNKYMKEKISIDEQLRTANQKLQDGRFEDAIQMYQELLQQRPELESLIRFNLEWAKYQQSGTEWKEEPLPESTQTINPHQPTTPINDLSISSDRYALVIHVFHLDTLDDLSAHVRYFPAAGDQFVTCPDSFSLNQVNHIRHHFPLARIFRVPNIGQDVGALIHLMNWVDFSHYGFICKIHTKKGRQRPVEWRRALLAGVLGDSAQIERTISTFHTDPTVMLAGAKQLFVYGPTHLMNNTDHIRKHFTPLLGDFDFETADWGFIAGTCFWIRSTILLKIKAQLDNLEINLVTYADDGTLSHAMERMFGLMVAVDNGKLLLHDVLDHENSKIVTEGFPADSERGSVEIYKLLRQLYDIQDDPNQLRGWIHAYERQTIVDGWLALIGDPTPREIMVQIGDSRIETVAARLRSDLMSAGINEGRHAFSIVVPGQEIDGKPKDIVLIDKQTSTVVAKKVHSWMPRQPDYVDFQGFLKSSMTQPLIERPFVESDRRCFAVMEGIANQLCVHTAGLLSPPLVSVIMPVYNRAGIVAEAIHSVLAQTYQNFELIVVDDGSTDNSVAAVQACNDSRIRLVVLPENGGQSTARNAGLKIADGEIIAYLDSDNAWDERYLAAVVAAFDQLPQADAAYSGMLLYRNAESSPYAVRYGHFHRGLLENCNYIDTNVFAHRRELGERLDGFDQSLKRFPDYDLILRSSEIGTLYSLPMLLCRYYHNKADNTMTNNPYHLEDMQVLHQRLYARTAEKLRTADRQNLTHPVAVIIPNWQSQQDIDECLNALCAKDWKGQLHIIVVDNASDRDVVDYLTTRKKAGDIELISNSINYGFSYAVNQGIARAATDADILVLNNDAIVQGGAIQALQQACHTLPKAGITVPRQILPAGTKTLRTHVPYADKSRDCDVNISAHHHNIAYVPTFHDGKALELTYAPFFAAYIRREVITDIGVLDAEYGRHYRSDRVYCDMARHIGGYKIYYIPDAFIIHKLQKATDHLRDSSTDRQKFELMFQRNQWDQETAAALGFRFAPWDTTEQR